MLFPRILTGLWALPTIRSGTNGLLKPRLNLTRKDFVEFLPNALSPGARFITIDGAIGGARALRTRGLASRARQLLEMYKKLSKAKLSGFVVATACTGYVLGSGERVDWAGLGWTALGTMGAAACANALNQIIEVGNDRLMGRTATRPLPSGRVTRGHALCFAAVTGVAGVGILAWKVGAGHPWDKRRWFCVYQLCLVSIFSGGIVVHVYGGTSCGCCHEHLWLAPQLVWMTALSKSSLLSSFFCRCVYGY